MAMMRGKTSKKSPVNLKSTVVKVRYERGIAADIHEAPMTAKTIGSIEVIPLETKRVPRQRPKEPPSKSMGNIVPEGTAIVRANAERKKTQTEYTKRVYAGKINTEESMENKRVRVCWGRLNANDAKGL